MRQRFVPLIAVVFVSVVAAASDQRGLEPRAPSSFAPPISPAISGAMCL